MKCIRLTSQGQSLGLRSHAHVARKAHSWQSTSIVLLVVDAGILSLNEKASRDYSPTIAMTHLTNSRTPIISVRTISTRNTPGI